MLKPDKEAPGHAATQHHTVIGLEQDFRCASREAVFNSLLDGVRLYDGLLVLLGEAGAGKTRLLHRLRLEAPGSVRFVFCPNGKLDFDQLLSFVCDDLGLPLQTPDQSSKLKALKAHLTGCSEHGTVVVLLIDEADELADEVLSQFLTLIRSLTRERRAFKLVLSGLPALQDKLTQQRLRHPAVAKAVLTRLSRLNATETAAYVHYRLKILNNSNDSSLIEFASEAIERIVHHGQGIAGNIDALSQRGRALVLRSKQTIVSAEVIDAVALKLQKSAPDAASLESQIPVSQPSMQTATQIRGKRIRSARWRRSLLAFSRRARLLTLGSALIMCAFVAVGALYISGGTDSISEVVEKTALPTSDSTTLAVAISESEEATSVLRGQPETDPVASTIPAIPASTLVTFSTPTEQPDPVEPEFAKLSTEPAAVADPPPSASITEAPLEPKTEALIAKAWAAFENKALTTPTDNNAVKWAESALQIDPQNAAAGQVLSAVIGAYLDWSSSSLERGKLSSASSYLSKAQSLQPYASTEQQLALDVLSGELQSRQQRNGSRTNHRTASRSRPSRRRSSSSYSTSSTWSQKFDSKMRTLGRRIDRTMGTSGKRNVRQGDLDGYGSR